jgi:hypothetical protein
MIDGIYVRANKVAGSPDATVFRLNLVTMHFFRRMGCNVVLSTQYRDTGSHLYRCTISGFTCMTLHKDVKNTRHLLLRSMAPYGLGLRIRNRIWLRKFAEFNKRTRKHF